MKTLWEVLALGRSRIPGFVLVAVLVSLGTGASLVEPWIYRAIIDDVAGVFVEPAPLARIESAIENLGRSREHLGSSGRRVFQAPLRKTEPAAPRRSLVPRTVHQALATVLTGVDRVVVRRDGRIEQDGPPQELLKADGYFRQMMTTQERQEA